MQKINSSQLHHPVLVGYHTQEIALLPHRHLLIQSKAPKKDPLNLFSRHPKKIQPKKENRISIVHSTVRARQQGRLQKDPRFW